MAFCMEATTTPYWSTMKLRPNSLESEESVDGDEACHWRKVLRVVDVFDLRIVPSYEAAAVSCEAATAFDLVLRCPA
jgi:hypothetical protein